MKITWKDLKENNDDELLYFLETCKYSENGKFKNANLEPQNVLIPEAINLYKEGGSLSQELKDSVMQLLSIIYEGKELTNYLYKLDSNSKHPGMKFNALQYHQIRKAINNQHDTRIPGDFDWINWTMACFTPEVDSYKMYLARERQEAYLNLINVYGIDSERKINQLLCGLKKETYWALQEVWTNKITLEQLEKIIKNGEKWCLNIREEIANEIDSINEGE